MRFPALVFIRIAVASLAPWSAAAFAAGAAAAPEALPDAALFYRLAPYKLARLDGSAQGSLDPRGPPSVAVIFWASWCEYCRESLIEWKGVRARHPEALLSIVYVNLDENPAAGLAAAKSHGIPESSFADPKGLLKKAAGIRTLPTAFVFDRSRLLRARAFGYSRKKIAELEKTIVALGGGGGENAP